MLSAKRSARQVVCFFRKTFSSDTGKKKEIGLPFEEYSQKQPIVNSMYSKTQNDFLASSQDNLKKDTWFQVTGYQIKKSLFGSLVPAASHSHSQYEMRSLIKHLPNMTTWSGNNPNFPSSPVSIANELNIGNHSVAYANTSLSEQEKGDDSQAILKNFLPIKLMIHCVANNVFVNLSGIRGHVYHKWSTGTLGFKGAQKMTSKAALAMMDAVFAKLDEMKIDTIRVDFRGVNPLRQILLAQLKRNGLKITEIIDSTKIPHNGPRPQKARRV